MEIRVPPHNIEAEQSVLGSILVNDQYMSNIIEIIEPSDFYRETHKLIFEAMVSLYRDRIEITSITLYDRLEKFGQQDKCGGNDYIISLATETITSSGWEYHCKIIKDKSQTRKLIEICSLAAETGFSRFVDNDDIINNLKNSIKKIENNRKIEEDSTPDLIYTKMKEIEDRCSNQNNYNGYLTGFENIDSKMKGLSEKTTTYLMARPSIGKTSLALNIGYNIANLYDEKQVLFFSLESSKSLLLDRLLSNLSMIPLSAIQSGNINNSRWPMLTDAFGRIALENLWFYESTKFKRIDFLRAKCETKASIMPISLIIIDHIQLSKHPSPGSMNRNNQLDEISSDISDIAKDLNCHCLVLSQINRGLEKRSGIDKKPQLSDMRDSGTLEQNADNVWGLHRNDKESDIAELEQLKGRDKGTWNCELRFDRFTQRYQDKFEM